MNQGEQLPYYFKLVSDRSSFDAVLRDGSQAASELQRRFDALKIAPDANGASVKILERIYAGTALAMDRTSKSAAESAAVFTNTDRAAASLAAEMTNLQRRIDPAATAQLELERATERVDQALRRGIITSEFAAQANSRLRADMAAGVGTMGNMRQATLQAGQQLQDIGISLYSGQQAAVVFAQQLPQLAFALTGLEGSANKTQDKIGKLANFLAGPWGLLVGVAVGVVGTLIAKLFTAGEEAIKTGSAMDSLANKLDLTKASYKTLIEVVEEYNQSQSRSSALTYDAILAAQKLTTQLLAQAKANLAAAEADQLRGGGGPGGFGGSSALAANAIASNLRDRIKALEENQKGIEIARIERETEIGSDKRLEIETRYNREILGFQQLFRNNQIDAIILQRKQVLLEKQKREEIERYEASQRRTNATTRTKQQVFEDFRRELSERGIVQAAGRTGYRTAADQAEIFRSGQSPLDGLRRVSRHQTYQALDPTRASHDDNAARAAAQAAGLRGFKIVTESGGRKHYEWTGAGGAGEADVAGSERADAAEQRRAERRARELQALADFGARAGESIRSISERFDEQPRLIDSVAASTRDLDAIMADLAERKPQGFAEMIKDAERAKVVVEDSINRPLREMLKADEEQAALHSLRIGNYTAEAEILERVLDLGRSKGSVTEAEVAAITEIIQLEQQRGIELEKQQETLSRNMAIVDGTQDNLRQGIRDLLGGGGFNAIGDTVKRQFDIYLDGLADEFASNLFGDTFRQQKLKLLGLDKVDEAGKEMAQRVTQVADSLGYLTESITGAARSIGAANDNLSLEQRFDAQLGAGITVNGPQTATRTARELFKALAETTFGPRFADTMADAMQRAGVGAAIGGMVGGRTGQLVGGGLTGLLSVATGGNSGFGKLIGGLQQNLPLIGTAIALNQGLNTLLGNDDRVGGGLLHTVLGPLGSLFLKKKSGSTTLSSTSGALGYSGSGSYRDSTLASGSGVQSTLASIIERLGGSEGAFRVSIGQRGKDYVVDPTGAGRTKGNGVLKFKNEADAARAALLDAIKDGAVAGISAGAQRLLQAGKDIEKQLDKALKLQSVFDRLKEIDDPVGAALEKLDREFASLRSIAAEAGEGLVEVERLYGIERAKTVEEANQRITASLRGLYESLTSGSDAISLYERRGFAKAAFDPLYARVAAGDQSANDAFAEAARTLLDIEREISGSGEGYFSLRDQILKVTKDRIDGVPVTGAASNDNLASANDNVPVVGALNDQTAAIIGIGNTTNALLLQLVNGTYGGGRSGLVIPGADLF
jgi:ribosomal protein S20